MAPSAGHRLPATAIASASPAATPNVARSVGLTPASSACRHAPAKRHAHGDLAAAPGDDEGEQSVDADASQQDGEAGKRREHTQLRATRRHLVLDHFAERADIGHRLLRVGALDDASHGGCQRRDRS